MVNPYVTRQRVGGSAPAQQQQQQQQQQRPTSNVSLGSSQALKKFESIQRKHQKAELKKIKKEAKSTKVKGNSAMSIFDTTDSDEEDDDDDSSSDDTTDSILKNVKSNASKFLKKIPPSTAKHDHESDEDVEEDIGMKKKNNYDEDEDGESIEEETFRYSNNSSPNVAALPSTSRSPLSSAKQKNRVTFEKKVSHKNKSPSEVTEISTTNIEENSDYTSGDEDAINKNVIFDINDLDANESSSKKPSGKKETVSIIKKKSNRKKDRSESEKKDSSIIDTHKTSDYDDEDDDSLSSVRRNVILDIDDLEQTPAVASKKTGYNSKPPKSDTKKAEPPLKSSLSKKNRRRRNGSRSHSIVSQDSDSIITEIINENIETEESIASETYHTYNESTAHRVSSASRQQPKTQSYASNNYQEDFDTESDVSKIQSVVSKSNYRTAASTSAAAHNPSSKKSVEIQCNDVDLLKHSGMLIESPLFTPFSVASRQVDWNKYLDLNVANNAFNDLMKMNLNFMKNFISIQRQLYESEMKKLQAEVVNNEE